MVRGDAALIIADGYSSHLLETDEKGREGGSNCRLVLANDDARTSPMTYLVPPTGLHRPSHE